MIESFQRYRLKSPFLLAKRIKDGEMEIVFTDGNAERADAGDWIVMDAHGKRRVCKAEIFERIYECDTAFEGG